MIGNPVNNLNTVMDTYHKDEPHTDKQHPTQTLLPFENCLTFSLSQVSLVLPLKGGSQRRVLFHFVFEQLSIDAFWGTFTLIVADRRNKGCQCSCLKELATQYIGDISLSTHMAVKWWMSSCVLLPNVE